MYFEFQINCNKSYLNLYASNSTIMGLRVVRRNIIGHSIRIGVGHSQGRGQARQDNSDKCLHYKKSKKFLRHVLLKKWNLPSISWCYWVENWWYNNLTSLLAWPFIGKFCPPAAAARWQWTMEDTVFSPYYQIPSFIPRDARWRWRQTH